MIRGGSRRAERLAEASKRPDPILTADDLFEINTGWEAEVSRWREGQERQRTLAQQTADLADRLEGLGIPARLLTDHVAIGAVTGQVDKLDSYRSIKFLPTVAQRERRPLLNGLKYWQQHAPGGKYLRYAVVTSGVVFKAHGPMRRVSADLKSRIRKWASDAWKAWRVKVQFRGVEYTRKLGSDRVRVSQTLCVEKLWADDAATLARELRDRDRRVVAVVGSRVFVRSWVEFDEDDEDEVALIRAHVATECGVTPCAVEHALELPSLHERDPARFAADEAYYHVHANVLYLPRGVMADGEWELFLSWTRYRLGALWQDCGRLVKPEEAIKYSFKPQDIAGVKGEELRWLFEETFRAHDVQPMGDFKAWCRGLADHTEEERRDGLDYETGEIVEEIARVKRPLKVAVVNVGGKARLQIVKKRRAERPPSDGNGTGCRENLVMTVMSPQWRFTPWAEPVILVAGYTTNPTSVASRDNLGVIENVMEAARKAWDDNGAPDPATALAVARGWSEAPTDASASVVVAFPGAGRRPEPYSVHTSGVSVLSVVADDAGPKALPSPHPAEGGTSSPVPPPRPPRNRYEEPPKKPRKLDPMEAAKVEEYHAVMAAQRLRKALEGEPLAAFPTPTHTRQTT